MMNLYLVKCQPTDGTYMFEYVQAAIIAAKDETEARAIADDVGVRGKPEKFTVTHIGTGLVEESGEIERFYTRDY